MIEGLSFYRKVFFIKNMLNVVVYVNYKFGGFGEFWFVFNVMVFMIDIDVIIR